jgi:hypothetical protein
MKSIAVLAAAVLVINLNARPQGYLSLDNVHAPTHLGSIDGPLAGTGIWAQFFAGATADSLAPVGAPVQHLTYMGLPTGRALGGVISVPWGVPGQTAYEEMLAWDGTRWGTAFSGVPKDQFGTTDFVPVEITGVGPGWSPELPPFTRSAIVPVPEPSVLGIAVIGGLGALLLRACWQRPGSGSGRLAHRPGR